jgi:serine/threonine protein kinase
MYTGNFWSKYVFLSVGLGLPMQLPIIFNDRYQLNRKLGEGGLAEVYLAQDLALGRQVAIKLLREQYISDPTFLVRFHREAQNAASLNSSNIVSVYDFGQDHHRPYIVMEYVPGDNLRTIMDRGLLSVPQTIDYGIQICNAVGLAHRRGIVHGDLKPGNIMISPENQAKVTDFGLARALGESAMDDGELVWGTPAYFAPEQAAGDRVLPATDVYAIGIVLYEMLTGTVPFVGETDQEVARKQLYEHPSPLSHYTTRIPAALENLVYKTLMKNPGERFHTADQLKQALLQLKQSVDGYTPFQPNVSTPPPQQQPLDWLTLLLGILAIIAILGLVPLWTQVYRVYIAQKPPVNLLIPRSTLGPEPEHMLSLHGFSETNVQSILTEPGLKVAVSKYEPLSMSETFFLVRCSVASDVPNSQNITVHLPLNQAQNIF